MKLLKVAEQFERKLRAKAESQITKQAGLVGMGNSQSPNYDGMVANIEMIYQLLMDVARNTSNK